MEEEFQAMVMASFPWTGHKLPRLHNSEFSQELKGLRVFPTLQYQEGGIK